MPRPATRPTTVSGPDDFAAATGVSRETTARLERYADLLVKWQSSINLVGRSTLPDLWARHMLDSAQLLPLLPDNTRTLIDFGSGAGFPGLVLACLGIANVHLVESDTRKAAFLREAARAADVQVTVHAARIESLDPFKVDAVTARALAPVADLLSFAEPFLAPHTACLFLKGQNVDAELIEARKTWHMTIERFPSRTEADATILRLKEVHREHPV